MNANELRKQIDELESELAAKKAALYIMESRCLHEWRETMRTVQEGGYTIPPDPYTGGIHFEGETHVPMTIRRMMDSTCVKCGKTMSREVK